MAIEPSLLAHFEPLRLMAMEHLVEIAAMSTTESVEIGADVLQTSRDEKKFVYLLKGDIRLAYQDGTEVLLSAGTPQAIYSVW